MLKIDLHIHSIASGHSLNTVYELAKVAKDKGLTHIGITEHGPLMKGAPHEGYFWISNQVTNLSGVKIYLGIEANILNEKGDIDLNEKLLSKQRIVIAGLHKKTPYDGMDQDANTKSIINAMQNPLIKIIAHPYHPEFPINIERIVQVAYETKTLLEINDNLFSRKNQLPELIERYSVLVKMCKKFQMPVVLNSDAHFAEKIGSDKNILPIKETIGLNNEMIINYNPQLLFDYLRIE